MRGHTCCTGWFEAKRTIALPRGGTIEVELHAPCGQGAAISVGDDWAVGPGTEAPFDGVIALTVPADPAPRLLTINVTGGLHCCGDVEVRAVAVDVAP
jgi:hypothetical protein